MMEAMALTAAPDAQALEQYRTELTGYCYRMLGSAFEAEDAVQETMVRAWRALDRFEGRSALRSWLYSIATNVCLDMLNGKQRRVRPMELGDAGTPVIEPSRPAARRRVDPADAGLARSSTTAATRPRSRPPRRRSGSRSSRRSSFCLPSQRAVLILRDVLRWKASEVAELLDTSEASVNSALQRARASVDEHDIKSDEHVGAGDGEHADLLARYMEAFERYDIEALTALLHEDATLSMPPYELWLTGPRRHRGVAPRAGQPVPRLTPDPDPGERHRRLRPVPAERPERRTRAVGAWGARDQGRQGDRAQLVPRHREPVPAVRAAGVARRLGSRGRRGPRPA